MLHVPFCGSQAFTLVFACTSRFRYATSRRPVIDLVPATDAPDLPGSTLRRFWNGETGSGTREDDLVFAGVTGRSWLPDDRERQFGNLVAAFAGDLRYSRYGEQSTRT